MSSNVHSPVPTIHSPFNFKNQLIRTTIIDEKPWFAAKDVCSALSIRWTGHTLDAISDGWRRVVKLTTHRRGAQSFVVINEPAVYKLAFRSNKPEADEFTNWVASEVLPALRQEGHFELRSEDAPKPLSSKSTTSDRKPLKDLIAVWVSQADRRRRRLCR